MDNKPIYWHEGLFLRPQHFQQQDIFTHEQLCQFMSLSLPYLWGVNDFDLVQSALNNQIFEIEKCKLRFQDGTYVTYPGNAQIRYRSFEGKWDATGGPLPVYIGLRKLNQGETNIDSTGDVEAPAQEMDVQLINRYWLSPRSSPVFDLYADRQQEGVQFLQYHLGLFFGNESAQAVDYNLIKIAELERFGNEIRVSEEYIPPLLNLSGSQTLLRMTRDIKEQLTSRARELALYKKEMSESGNISGRDIPFIMALRTLNRYIPAVHRYAEQGQVLPWEYYAMLRQIVGEMSTFSMSYDVFGAAVGSAEGEGLLPYRHEDIWSCFSRANHILSDLLNELTAGPDFSSSLSFDGTYFAAELNERIFQGNNRFYLRVHAKGNQDQIVKELQSIAKVSSREYLPILIARALPGVNVQFLATPPNELPRRSDSFYFELDHLSEAWDSVRERANLAVYFDNPPNDIDMEVLVVYN